MGNQTEQVKKLLKQNVGVEVDSKWLKLSYQVMEMDMSIKIKGSKKFSQTSKGLNDMHTWLDQKRNPAIPLHMTMEATGVYHESLAYYFHSIPWVEVHVILPNISNAYMKSLNNKSKTDDIDKRALGQMGLERQFKIWQPVSSQMRQLKKINRERLRLQKEKTMVMNQLAAEKAAYDSDKDIMERSEKRIDFINKQIKEIEKQLITLVDEDTDLAERIKKVCTIKGVGITTAIGIIAEMNGFILFNNRNQIVSYAGYDVVKRESGTSVRGKTKISKKGNSYVRQMMYMGAMSAARYDEHHKNYYQRIVEKTSLPMKANVAIQRKLLLLIYALFTKNEAYDEKYHSKLKEKLEKSSLLIQTKSSSKQMVGEKMKF